MKKFIILSLFLFAGKILFGQTTNRDSIIVEYDEVPMDLTSKVQPLSKKGQMFVFWGYNRAAFTHSDIHFKGSNYDFTLENVVAHDRPSAFSLQYFNLSKISIPQFNFRLGYFIKDNLALVIAQDHMKYVMDQDQIAKVNGTISDPVYSSMVKNGEVNLQDEQFLTFEHTDGLNYVNIGLEKYKTLITKKDFDLVLAYGGGIGALFPKSNVKLFGNERSDRYHVAGFGLDGRTNLNAVFWNHLMVRLEAKAGYINMPDIKTTLINDANKASQSFFFAQLNFGLGYTFNTKKYK